jgi:anti-sigma28 factor (negative regulator of flagellin synthesis)
MAFGAYIKVICVNRTNPFVFDMMLDKLNNSSPADVIVVENTPDFSVLTEDEENGSTSGDDSHDHQDTQAVLNKCIDELQIEIDNQKMKKLMADIYTEALSAEDVT